MKHGWTKRWMQMAQLVATWSKDKSRRTGCVIVDERQCIVSLGWNGFPRGVDDFVPERRERPLKMMWTHHAETNAICNAAANGHKTLGCTMYLIWYPCATCAREIIQAGITALICVEPDWNDANWKDDFSIVRDMLDEARIKVEFVEGMGPPESAE